MAKFFSDLFFASVRVTAPPLPPPPPSSALQKIKRVCSLEFMPYVVFVKPPRLEELRLTRRRAKVIGDGEDTSTVRIFSVSALGRRVKVWALVPC